MSFRRKLLLVLAATVVVVTLAVSISVASIARHAFERQERARSQAIAAQFRREFERSGEDVVRRVSAVAQSDAVRRIALDVPRALNGAYLNDAASLAQAHGLDFLDIVTADGTIVSSAEFPARFGYKDEWAGMLPKLSSSPAALRKQALPNNSSLAIVAVQVVRGSDQPVYAIGGVRLDSDFVARLWLPGEGDTMVGLFTVEQATSDGSVDSSRAAIENAIRAGKETEALTQSDSFHIIPLAGATHEVLAVLDIATSTSELVRTEQHIRSVALVVAGIGIVLAILISGWIATRVTRPVEQLAAGAARVAGGDWNAHVDVSSRDELGQLADAFNRMTGELINQRDRLLQTERVAAWRELARRLAHELKNPLFPLQITVENLVRARQLSSAEFDEVFRESTDTLLKELANLRTIIGRFSDFSKMPKPQLEVVSLNEIVADVAKLHEAQLAAREHAISLEMQLDPAAPVVEADGALLHRALSNLVLNAVDAMPDGGRIAIRTEASENVAAVEVADSGTGMTPEECERLFTPYYTTKQHGTGLGLAIVQSVVSDHGGKITVRSDAGQGTTFRIELPLASATPPLIHADER